jgi:hypothetical protein
VQELGRKFGKAKVLLPCCQFLRARRISEEVSCLDSKSTPASSAEPKLDAFKVLLATGDLCRHSVYILPGIKLPVGLSAHLMENRPALRDCRSILSTRTAARCAAPLARNVQRRP